MTRYFVLLCSCVLLLAGCAGTSHAPIAEDRIRAVEQNLLPAVVEAGIQPSGMSLQDRMSHYLVPGVSIAVINNGQIEWARGFGVTEAGGTRQVTANSVFQAASISKSLAATAVMFMAQSGLIDINREVNDYLTSWKIPDNQYTASQKVLVRHLLSHTGGTTVSGFTGYRYDESVPSLLQVLDGLPPANSEAVRVEAVR
jgi:CubicO group peptidase (beta-lactamase class C family)